MRNVARRPFRIRFCMLSSTFDILHSAFVFLPYIPNVIPRVTGRNVNALPLVSMLM